MDPQPLPRRPHPPLLGIPVKDLQLPLTVAFLLLGIGLASQVRTQQFIRKAAVGNRIEVLADRYRDALEQVDKLRTDVDSLRKTVSDYEGAASENSTLIEKMNSELQETKAAAGLVAVRGPGIQVLLEDSEIRARTAEEQNAYLVHDIDLLQLVNELKAAGAEALAVNDQRIVAMSEIRCVGPSVKVNGTTIASPYTVQAVGDPAALKSALELRMGLLDMLQALNIKVKVVKKDIITIPPAQTGPVFKHGKPVPQAKLPKGEEAP